MAKKKSKKIEDPSTPVTKRLDALIRVLAETLYNRDDKKFEEADIIRLLNSAGLTPTEIARILGKKGPTAISWALYDQGNAKKRGD